MGGLIKQYAPDTREGGDPNPDHISEITKIEHSSGTRYEKDLTPTEDFRTADARSREEKWVNVKEVDHFYEFDEVSDALVGDWSPNTTRDRPPGLPLD